MHSLLACPLFALGLCFPFVSAAAPPEVPAPLPQGVESINEMAASLAGCAGFWTWLSESTRRGGKPAAADYIKTYANGAYSSALWLLAAQYALENQDGEPRTYGSFGGSIDGSMEIERLRLTALEESEDMAEIERRYVECEALTSVSEMILKDMRDGS